MNWRHALHHEPLDVVPLWGLFLAMCVLTWLALEGGYRLGRWRHDATSDEKDAPVGAMVAAVLGLLAFMLAFTFSMAASRFESRRQAVLEEANAIGTTYLRARLLPEPQRGEVAKLLREYVDVRVRGIREGKIAEAVARSEELHEQLWSQATAAAEKNPGSIMTGLFIQSLNDVIDLHAKRVHGRDAKSHPDQHLGRAFRSRRRRNGLDGLPGRLVGDAPFAGHVAAGPGLRGRSALDCRPGPRAGGISQSEPGGDDRFAEDHAAR